MNGGLTVEIVNTDAKQFEADVLALKYAQHHFGLDEAVANLLKNEGHEALAHDQPPEGEFRFIPSHGVIRAPNLLIVGIQPIHQFTYGSVRELGYRFLSSLVESREPIRHLAATLHGVGFGLEVVEAFRAELLGMADAFSKGQHPPALERISIVERNKGLSGILSLELDKIRDSHPLIQQMLRLPSDIEGIPHVEGKQIFISYARVDQSFAFQLSDDLLGEKLNVWLDQIAIKPGQHWDKEVQEALKKSPIMILILSPTSAESDNVADEYHYFLQNKKTIIPVLTPDFDMADMPYRLSRLQFIDFKDGYFPALDTLVKTVHHVIAADA